jgi:hypothetical protein
VKKNGLLVNPLPVAGQVDEVGHHVSIDRVKHSRILIVTTNWDATLEDPFGNEHQQDTQ